MRLKLFENLDRLGGTVEGHCRGGCCVPLALPVLLTEGLGVVDASNISTTSDEFVV